MDDIEAIPASEDEGARTDLNKAVSQLASRPLIRQAIKYTLTTGLSACLSLGLPIVLVELFDFAERAAVLIGFVCAYLFNLVVLRSFVFQSQSHWARDTAKYVLTSGALRALEFGGFIVLAEWIGIHYAAALLIVLIVATITKFFAYRYVFR